MRPAATPASWLGHLVKCNLIINHIFAVIFGKINHKLPVGEVPGKFGCPKLSQQSANGKNDLVRWRLNDTCDQISNMVGQLLGIAQRTVEALLPDFKQKYSARKLIPTEVKTLGDHLLLRRIKADLSQPEVAAKTGFTVRKIKAWEHDRIIPTEAEWHILAKVLDLETRMRPPG